MSPSPRGLRYFGTAGIRGFTNEEVDPPLARRLGLALGSIYGEVVVSRDTRKGSAMLARAAISGIMEAGGTAYDIGVATLPMTATASSEMGIHALAVTGSHTPPNISGLVVIDSDGSDIYWDESARIEGLMEKPPPRRGGGRYYRLEAPIEAYLRRVEGFIGDPPSGFRVAVDAAEGSLSGYAQLLFRHFGLEVKDVETSGTGVPARHPEPRGDRDRLIRPLMDWADVGVLTDMDADRVVFVTKGGYIDENSIGAFFASRYSPGGVVVTPINSSGTIVEASRKAGFKIVWCRIGPPEIAHASKESGADFAYEETGKYMFVRDGFLWGDAVLSTLYLLKLTDGDLGVVEAEFPRRAQLRLAVDCPSGLKPRVMEEAAEAALRAFPEAEAVTVDGLKLVFPDSSWLLIRPSGTEPVMRVYSEALDEGRARELSEIGKELVLEAIAKAEKRL